MPKLGAKRGRRQQSARALSPSSHNSLWLHNEIAAPSASNDMVTLAVARLSMIDEVTALGHRLAYAVA